MTILAYKYEVDHVRAEALRRLRAMCVFTFDAWNAWAPGRNAQPTPVVFRLHDFIGLVNLARMFNLPELLPLALHACCRLTLDALPLKIHYGQGQYEQLSHGDLRLYLRAIDILSKANTTRLNLFLDFAPADTCIDPARCMHLTRELTRLANDRGYFTLAYLLRPLQKALPEVDTFCDCCRLKFIYRLDNLGKVTWNSLGQMFGVEAWPIVEI